MVNRTSAIVPVCILVTNVECKITRFGHNIDMGNEFPKRETLSHKLTWSHYFEILKSNSDLEYTGALRLLT